MNNSFTTIDKDQRKAARSVIVDIVRKMLNRELNIKWVGRKIDLFEMIHIAYVSMEIRREDDTLMYQSEMIRSIFAWQNISVPTNERVYGNRINARKGVQAKSILERVQHLLFVSNMKAEPVLLLQKMRLAEPIAS